MSTNGFNPNAYTINGLNNIYADTVESSIISCDTFLNQPSSFFTNISSNLQSQIDTINSVVSTGSTGGGFFTIVASSASGYNLTNPFWALGGGGISNVNVPLINSFDFKVDSITVITQSTPTSSATVALLKNGINVFTMPIGTVTSKTFLDMNVIYLAGDSISILTTTGSGGTSGRITISCSVGGVTGATPNLSIGNIQSVPFGSGSSASITGTTLNPVLNLGIEQGPQGIQGVQGVQGSQGPKGDKGDKGEPGDIGGATAAGAAAGAAAGGTAGAVAGATAGASSGASAGATSGSTAGAQAASTAYEARVQALEGKTTLIQSDSLTSITLEGDVNIGAIGGKVLINGTTGNISTIGVISLGLEGSTITLSSNGSIVGDSINVNSAIVQDLSTTTVGNQYIYGSSLVIGNPTNTSTIQMSGNINIGQLGITTSTNLNGLVYINGVLLEPFSKASSFFSQW